MTPSQKKTTHVAPPKEYDRAKKTTHVAPPKEYDRAEEATLANASRSRGPKGMLWNWCRFLCARHLLVTTMLRVSPPSLHVSASLVHVLASVSRSSGMPRRGTLALQLSSVTCVRRCVDLGFRVPFFLFGTGCRTTQATTRLVSCISLLRHGTLQQKASEWMDRGLKDTKRQREEVRARLQHRKRERAKGWCCFPSSPLKWGCFLLFFLGGGVLLFLHILRWCRCPLFLNGMKWNQIHVSKLK